MGMAQKGLKCDKVTGECKAKRNGHLISVNEEVTPEQVDAYQKGKDETMTAGGKMVGPNGTWFGNGAGSWQTIQPPFGENLMMMKYPADPATLINQVRTALQNYRYLVVGCENCYSSPVTETSALESKCDETKVANFLLAVKPGAFLLCNGWDEKFALPLGSPNGLAKQDPETGEWTRSFAGGTRVSWLNGSGKVQWASLASSL